MTRSGIGDINKPRKRITRPEKKDKNLRRTAVAAPGNGLDVGCVATYNYKRKAKVNLSR